MKPDWLNRLIRQDSTAIATAETLPAISRLLQPCQADKPCGEDVGQHEVFLQVKDNLSLLSGLDCLALEQDCCMLLQQQGKDLRPAVYLAYAWLRQRGWEGLQQGLQLLGALSLHYGTALYPKRQAARHAILAWLGSSKVLDWLASLGVPPRHVQQAMQQQLDGLAEQWADHAIVLEHDWDQLRSMLATTDDGQANHTTASATMESSPQASPAVIASSQMLLEQVRAMCGYLRQQPEGAFAAFRLARVVRWDSITQAPPHDGQQQTRLPGPRPELRQHITRLLLQKQWHALLEKTDSAFLEAANHFWLDLQYLAWQALGQLGESHQHWRDIALSDIALMRHRLCGIEQLCFADGSPFADNNTLEWLTSQAVVHDLSGTDQALGPQLISVIPANLGDIGQQALLLAEQQGLEAALGWLQTLPRPQGMRQQAQQLLLTARLAESCGRADIALGIVSGLEQQQCSPQICQWDPELVFDIKACHLQLLRQRGQRKDGDRQTLHGQMQRLLQDMSLLDPLRTALFASR